MRSVEDVDVDSSAIAPMVVSNGLVDQSRLEFAHRPNRMSVRRSEIQGKRAPASPLTDANTISSGSALASGSNRTWRDSWPYIMVLLWVCGVAVSAIRLLAGVLIARRIARQSVAITQSDVDELGVTLPQGVAVRDCPFTRVPVTTGWLKPYVLLPSDWMAWSPGKLAAVLAHEAAHVRRHDTLVMLLAELNRMVFWFHPLAWWLKGKLASIAESICDDAALVEIGSTAYAKHLLDVAARASASPSSRRIATVSMACSGNVVQRIDWILDADRPRAGSLSRSSRWLLFLSAASIVAATAALGPDNSTNAAPPPGEPQAGVASSAKPSTNDSGNSTEEGNADQIRNRDQLLRGTVLDERGQPIEGVEVFTLQIKKGRPGAIVDLEELPLTRTQKDGRFAVQLPSESKSTSRHASLYFRKTGYAVNWMMPPKASEDQDSTEEHALTMVAELPFLGRILTTEGLPIANATILVNSIGRSKPGKRLDELLGGRMKEFGTFFHQAIDQQHGRLNEMSATSDSQGRFTINGIQRDGVASIEIRAEGFTTQGVMLLNRPGVDVEPINRMTGSRMLGRSGPPFVAPNPAIVMEPEFIVSGKITNDDGVGIPNICIVGLNGYNVSVSTYSDDGGQYKLTGLKRSKETLLSYRPVSDASGWLARTVMVDATDPSGQHKQDMLLRKGIVITGRVVDDQSGEGIQCGVRTAPLPGNKYFEQEGYDGYRRSRTMTASDQDGNFSVVAIPGKSVVLVQAHQQIEIAGEMRSPYMIATPTKQQQDLLKVEGVNRQRRFTAATGTLEFLSLHQAIEIVDLAPGEEPSPLDLTVHRGKTVDLEIVDQDGQPVSGAFVSGVTEQWPMTARLSGSNVRVHAVNQHRKRFVVFFHKARGLAGRITLDGDEGPAEKVVLRPAGSIRGRAIDQDGNPIAGLKLQPNWFTTYASELYRFHEGDLTSTVTDDDGNFEIHNLIVGGVFNLRFGWSRKHIARSGIIKTSAATRNIQRCASNQSQQARDE